MRTTRGSARTPSKLSESLLHRLDLYALAASAAGVGVVALANAAEAKIVYTPTHKVVRLNHAVPIDLNRDGIHDFDVFNLTHDTTPFGDYLAAEPLQSGNQMWVSRTKRGYRNYAAALPAGVRVGPGGKDFAAGRNDMASFYSGVSGGPWKNAKNRYLGFKYLIKGRTHYGWARLNVNIVDQNVDATLTGYAYETIPNKTIVTGRTKGEASLGVLALGR